MAQSVQIFALTKRFLPQTLHAHLGCATNNDFLFFFAVVDGISIHTHTERT